MPPRKDGIGRAGAEIDIGEITIHRGDYIDADQDAVIVLARPVHGL